MAKRFIHRIKINSLTIKRIQKLQLGYYIIRGGDIMASKAEKKRKNDNKTTNDKRANPVTLDVRADATEPVRGLPKV